MPSHLNFDVEFFIFFLALPHRVPKVGSLTPHPARMDLHSALKNNRYCMSRLKDWFVVL